MPTRPGLLTFALSVLLIASAYASAFTGAGARWGPWLLALGSAGAISSVMLLGASRQGRVPPALRLVFLATFIMVASGFGLALYLPAESTGAALWLGLPRRAAILIYGIGLAPVLLLPLAYALTFDRATLSQEELVRFRARIAAVRALERPDAARVDDHDGPESPT